MDDTNQGLRAAIVFIASLLGMVMCAVLLTDTTCTPLREYWGVLTMCMVILWVVGLSDNDHPILIKTPAIVSAIMTIVTMGYHADVLWGVPCAI